MRHAFAGATLAAALVFRAAGAHAEDAAPIRDPASTSRWYGYQTLLLDSVALATLPTGIVLTARDASADNTPTAGVALVGLGTTTYLLGAPIVHWIHGRVGVGFLSLGMRILAPIAGLGLGAVGSEIANGSKNQIGIPIGAAVGALAAMVVDATVLGWEKPAPDRVAKTRPADGLVPALVVTKQAVSVGVTWRF